MALRVISRARWLSGKCPSRVRPSPPYRVLTNEKSTLAFGYGGEEFMARAAHG